MEWDDDGVEDDSGAPLLPPEDRLWRHPSEVAFFAGSATGTGAPAALTPQRTRHERDLPVVAVVAITSCISVVLTMGVLSLVRPLKMRVAVERIATPVLPLREVSSTTDVADLAQSLRPAVASVVAERPGGDTWGSGVIYRSDGMLLTSHHIVSGAKTFRVILDSGVTVSAKLVGGDAETDVAVLDLDGENFPMAPLGHVDGLKVGQPTITVGAASGGAMVSVGVISALGQDVSTDGVKLVDMMQTDGAVAPGCAGAPVIDRRGAVIAMASANVTTASGVLGYATPIDVARSVAGQLVSTGKVTRGWLGVDGDSITVEQSKKLGVPAGTVVRTVRAGSPAALAGIVPTDVITAVDDFPIATMSALIARLRAYFPGDTVVVALLRDGEHRTVNVILGERPG